MRVLPAHSGTGVVIRHSRGSGPAHEIRAVWQNRRHARLCTALDNGNGGLVRTIEHLMASLNAFQIDNAIVELEGDELPIFDGSAVRWCHDILAVGVMNQAAARRYIEVLEPVEIREPNGHFIRFEPAATDARHLTLDVTAKIGGFGDLRWTGHPDPWCFLRHLAPSRSFGLLRWGLPLKLVHLFSREPLLRGANLWTTGIVWRGRYIGGMRVEDEPVRHRALDVIGDLMLAGHPMIAHVSTHNPRHELNYLGVAKLMETRGAWRLATLTGEPASESAPCSTRSAV